VIAFLRALRLEGHNQRHALVVGSWEHARWFADVIAENRFAGYKLVGILCTRASSAGEAVLSSAATIPVGQAANGEPDTDDDRVLGTTEDLDEVLVKSPVDEAFIVGTAGEFAQMAPIAQKLIERGRLVSLITPFGESFTGVRGRLTEFSGIPMISFGPMPNSGVSSALKRTVDVFLSSVVLMALAPVILIIALAIKVGHGGPVLFGQDRLGVGGTPFKLYKFRSMRADAEAVLKADSALYERYVANGYKLEEAEDPRLLPLGRFLRRTSLDEIPQLWNVLRGEMALVGPRPIVPAEIANYEPYSELFLRSRPGITGYWQIKGRSDVQYPARAFMDLDYVSQNSLLGDLAIIARTVPAVLRRKGAH
jgi:exopolysaccharide biosynthesis polyprenyl glycosylphosphotransferase